MLGKTISTLLMVPAMLCLSVPVLAQDSSNALDQTLEALQDESPAADEQAAQTDESLPEKEESDASDSEVLTEDGVLTEDAVMNAGNDDDAVLKEDSTSADEADSNSDGDSTEDTVAGDTEETPPTDGTPWIGESPDDDETASDSNSESESDKQAESQAADDTESDTVTGVDFLDGVTCDTDGPCVIDATGLPMRALPRSFTPLFDRPGGNGKMISNAVSGFKPVYVFAVEGIDKSDVTDVRGWYQVGFTARRAMGWMQARDVVEWRQALLLEYLHPGVGDSKRSPVLMFENKEALSDVVLSPTRKSDAASLLEAVNEGGVPEGVIGKEPAQFLNIDDTFYLLPVIDWDRTPLDEPSHYLQVFAAVPGARADEAGDSTLKDENYLAEDAFMDIKDSLVDIVFVMDMTGSMADYIEAVKESMEAVVKQIAGSVIKPERMRFGLVGYRDSIEVTPELEWNVKNFTPELQDADTFVKTISSARAASVSSDEWAEDVHGGYLAGTNSAWRSIPKTDSATGDVRNSVRFMILIGDASGHDTKDEKRGSKNSTGTRAPELQRAARANGIYPYTIYLQDARAEPDWALAQEQFGYLATDTTGEGRSTYSVSTSNAGQNINDTVQYIGDKVICRIESESEDECIGSPLASDDNAESEIDADSAAMMEIADDVMRAAFADYYGDSAKPAKDFLSWVHDYDLADPNREALGVRVLITRQQFDNIVRQTEILVDTMEGVATGNMDFYVALQSTSAKTSLGLDVSADQSLEEQEFLPKWVAALPYKSAVLAIKPTEFANLHESERRQFRAQLDSKHNAFLEIASDTGRWFKLDDNDDKLQEVVALPLTSLP